MVKTMRKHPIVVAIIGFIIGYCGIKFLPYSNDNISGILVRLGLGAVLLGIMILMGGKDSLKIFKKGFGFSLRTGLYFLVIAIITAVSAIGVGISKNNIPSDLIMLEISNFILCITVGIFEESMFRGVMLQGILKKSGKTYKGIWIAIIITSLLFGSIHVDSYIFGGNYDFAGVVQTIGKILQSGILGVLLSAIYLKTKNFWAIAFVHALNDFLAFQATVFKVENSSIGGGYVQSGTQGNMMVVGYVVMTLIYLPALIKAIKMMKKLKVPEYGIFEENKEYDKENVENDAE